MSKSSKKQSNIIKYQQVRINESHFGHEIGVTIIRGDEFLPPSLVNGLKN